MSVRLRRMLSAGLCAALLLAVCPRLPVLAAEAEETQAVESTPGETEATQDPAPETEEATVPEESTEETAVPSEPTAETEAPEPSEDTVPTEPAETTEETVSMEPLTLDLPELPIDLDWNFYFGQLHSHTNLSDGWGSVEDAFAYAAQVENLDFFAVTDHSDSFDHAEEGSLAADGSGLSSKWAAGKAAARAVTNEDFVGIFSFEMSWPEDKSLGHMNTFCTPGWQSWKQAEFSHSLETYYRTLTTVPGSIGQFNHPGPQYGDFENFGHYRADYDRQICLLEVAGEGSFTAYAEYTRALDAGWHVAPTTSQNNHNGHWGDARPDRTVILADELTESALFDAIRHHRVYATADEDLLIYYELDGRIMGSTLGPLQDPEIQVYLLDPTDEAIGLVEVIGDGGKVLASAQADASEDLLCLYPGGGYSYYYLRITQPDGDIAVTAPVWSDAFDCMGVSAFTASTLTPTQGQPLDLSATLYNDEGVSCRIQKLEFFIGDTLIHSTDAAGSLGPGDRFTYTFPYTHEGLGTTDIRLTVTGSVNGQTRVWSKTLTLQYRPGQIVTGLLVDGGHGSVPAIQNLTALAGQANMDVTVFETFPQGGEILLLFAPDRAYEDAFLGQVRAFAENGGSLILCGRSDGSDGDAHASAQLNTLLKALGSSMKLYDNTAVDPVNHGQAPDQLYTGLANPSASWCDGLTSAQYYAHQRGCTLDPGDGAWLVQGFDTMTLQDADGDGKTGLGRVLLASEETEWGGQILLSGSPFLSDSAMPLPKSKWAAPRINQTVLERLLEIEESKLPLSEIKAVRSGEPGQVFRVRGYVTAGTSNPYNRFPETVYIQDPTGGIAVVPFRAEGIQVGTALDITGYLEMENGMPALQWIDYDILPQSLYRWVPKTSRNETAMNYEKSGGTLMQVEGTAVKCTPTPDGRGLSRLTLRDYLGDEAEILIEDCIRSGANGENRLAAEIKIGRKVRAMGICHLDENGETVLRVRNCEEVVYVPPRRYPSDNPKTGDMPVIRYLWGQVPQ